MGFFLHLLKIFFVKVVLGNWVVQDWLRGCHESCILFSVLRNWKLFSCLALLLLEALDFKICSTELLLSIRDWLSTVLIQCWQHLLILFYGWSAISCSTLKFIESCEENSCKKCRSGVRVGLYAVWDGHWLARDETQRPFLNLCCEEQKDSLW